MLEPGRVGLDAVHVAAQVDGRVLEAGRDRRRGPAATSASSGANAATGATLLGRPRGQLVGALAVGRAQELSGGRRRCHQLVEVAQPHALGPQRVGLARLGERAASTRATRSSRSSRRRAASAASARAASSAASADAAVAPRPGHPAAELVCAGVARRAARAAATAAPGGGPRAGTTPRAAARRAPRGRRARTSRPRRAPGCGRSPSSRRATTSVSSPVGPQAGNGFELRLVEEVVGRSNSAST